MKAPRPVRDRFSDLLIGATLGLTLAVLLATSVDDADGKTTRPTVRPMPSAAASCYGPGLYGNTTANGTTLRPTTAGVAHKSLRFGTRIQIRANGRSTVVRVIDRGPYVHGRLFDLTEQSARHLGFSSCRSFGVRNVKYRVLRRR